MLMFERNIYMYSCLRKMGYDNAIHRFFRCYEKLNVFFLNSGIVGFA